MFSQDIQVNELLNAIDEKHLLELGYKSISFINEAKVHSFWKPLLIIKKDDGTSLYFKSEKEIIEKLKEMYKDINK